MIPFNRAEISDVDLEFLKQSVLNGHVAGNGPFTQIAEASLSRISGSPRTLLTTSCTHALEMAALLLNVQPGDEVIVPSYTFVSTALAFATAGATPVFVDVDEQTLNLSVDGVADAISERTKAVCTVHYGGVTSTIDLLAQLCSKKGIPLVEDNAHGLGATFKGKELGTWGQMSSLSFHETKNITSGEGGALCLNEPSLSDRAEILREKGTDRSRYMRGQVDKYTWVDFGSSWVMSDMLAAILVGQLESFQEIQLKRMHVWNSYMAELSAWADNYGFSLPYVPKDCDHSAHMFYVRLNDLDQRDQFTAHMKKNGISTAFHYQALNASPMGEFYGGRSGECPVSEKASNTLVRLPLFLSLTDSEIDHVISSAVKFVPDAAK